MANHAVATKFFFFTNNATGFGLAGGGLVGHPGQPHRGHRIFFYTNNVVGFGLTGGGLVWLPWRAAGYGLPVQTRQDRATRPQNFFSFVARQDLAALASHGLIRSRGHRIFFSERLDLAALVATLSGRPGRPQPDRAARQWKFFFSARTESGSSWPGPAGQAGSALPPAGSGQGMVKSEA